MFENGFPKHWSTLKKLIWLVGSGVAGGASAAIKTVSGAIVHITDALAKPAISLVCQINPVQSGTGDPSPDNVRPITGFTGLTVNHVGKNFIEVTQSNLCPSNNSKWHTYGENGCTLETNASGEYGVIFPVQPNTKYYIGFDTTNTALYIRCAVYSEMPTDYDSSSRISVLISNSGQSGNQRYEITTPAGAKYAFFGIYRTYGAAAKYLNKFFATTELPNEYTPYQSTTYPITWQTEAVYGGSDELISGVLTSSKFLIDDFTNLTVTLNKEVGIIRSFYLTIPSSIERNADKYVLSNLFTSQALTEDHAYDCEVDFVNYNVKQRIYFSISNIDYPGMTGAQAKQFLIDNNVQFLINLATPQTYQLDPVTVNLLLGENNLWHDANGNTELTYYADGTASTQEALGILLGGAYHNPGWDDDATDDEALGILLGS